MPVSGVHRPGADRGAGLGHPVPVVPSVRPCAALLLGLVLAAPAVPAMAGTAPLRAETRRKPPVAQTERVTATVSPGLLLISVAMPRPKRDDGRVHEAEPLEVVVRDSRPGTPGWSLGGIARNFAEQGGVPRASEAVRWIPRLVSAPRPSAVTVVEFGLGEPIEEDPGSAARQLARGAAGQSFGTTVVAVGLSVPLSSRDALYSGEVTFTVL